MNNKTRYAYVTYVTTVWRCAEIPYEEGGTEKDIINKFKEKYGKNAIMKAMNYQEGATAIERNGQVGGHNA